MYLGMFSEIEIAFIVIFVMVFGIIIWLGKLVKRIPRDSIFSKLDKNGFLFRSIFSSYDVIIDIISSEPIHVKLIYSESDIEEYDTSDEEIEIFYSSVHSKNIKISFPKKIGMKRYIFVYGKPESYIVAKFSICDRDK